MHDAENSCIRAALAHRLLNEHVSTGIDRCGRLVQQENFWVAQDGGCETQELALADRVVGPVIFDDSVELGLL